MQTYRCLLTGLGNIGRNFLDILATREALLRDRYNLALQIVGVADSSGTVYAPEGLNLAEVITIKREGRGVADLPNGQRGNSPVALTEQAAFDLLFEATPTNLRDGQPALDIVRTALRRGLPCVLASKGPLVLAYAELAALSDLTGPGRPALRFSGAVGGALPTINLGRRDLAGSHITRVEAVLNGTTQVILGLMAQGQSFPDALAAAQKMGIVEPDPSLDVDGWDAANKLVILANAVLGCPTTLADLTVTGISEVSSDQLQAAHAAGGRVSLLGIAEALPSTSATTERPYRLSIAPTTLLATHPLARLGLGEMGVVYTSDIAGRTTATSAEDGPLGTCAAMLRDAISIAGSPNY
ncbi:MAG: homoserine dehydrogenase [Herpetosiphonaceae bacterium]|nr:homoserine dehydrogenase [Herpetosiphonaceae bacterium]